MLSAPDAVGGGIELQIAGPQQRGALDGAAPGQGPQARSSSAKENGLTR